MSIVAISNSDKLTHDETIDAMCIWEALLEDEAECRKNDTQSAYVMIRDFFGAYHLRQLVLDVLRSPIRAGWESISNDFQGAFDWEYVPSFLKIAEKHFTGIERWHLSDDQGVEIAAIILSNKLELEANT